MSLKVIGIYGKSDTGKTTLVVGIIKRLTNEGFKVASVKISDKKIDIDEKDKDTWRHTRAGSSLVVLSSVDNTDFLLKQNLVEHEIINLISKFDDYDLILMEGSKDSKTPKIRLGSIKKRDNTILDYTGDFEKLINIIKNEI